MNLKSVVAAAKAHKFRTAAAAVLTAATVAFIVMQKKAKSFEVVENEA